MESLIEKLANYSVFFNDFGNYVLIPLFILILILDWNISKKSDNPKQKLFIRLFFGILGVILGALIYMTNVPLKPMIKSLSIVDKSIGKEIVEFSFMNVRTGEIEKLEHYQNKIVVLNFWGTYCGPCIQEFPDLKKLELTYPDKLVVIVISEETPEKIRKFITRVESPSIVGSQPDSSWINPEKFLPLTVIINNGIVKERYFGRRSFQEFVNIINKHLQ